MFPKSTVFPSPSLSPQLCPAANTPQPTRLLTLPSSKPGPSAGAGPRGQAEGPPTQWPDCPAADPAAVPLLSQSHTTLTASGPAQDTQSTATAARKGHVRGYAVGRQGAGEHAAGKGEEDTL